MAQNTEDSIRVVVFQEGDLWVAQCLEYDIGAQADDIEELRARLQMTLRAEAQMRQGTAADPFPGIDPAPPYFTEMWEKCTNELTPQPRMHGVEAEKPIRMALCA